MSKNPLDLNKLTMDDIDFSGVCEKLEQTKKIKKEYQKKYGNNWLEHYVNDTNPRHDVDWDEETINEAIYNGHRLCISGDPVWMFEMEKKYWDKMKRLFGPFYKKYVRHESNSLKVNRALLKDALKTGKWKELPKELQKEYHKMTGK